MTFSVSSLSTAHNASGGTLTQTITVPNGALVAVAVVEGTSTGTYGTLSDGANTYTAKAQLSPANTFTLQIFTAFNVTGLGSGATLTYTKKETGVNTSLTAFYVTGALTGSDPVDSAVTATNTGTNAPPAPTVTSGTPSVGGELFIGAVGFQGNGITAILTEPSGWSTPFDLYADTVNVSSTVGGGNIVGGASALTYNPTINNGNNANRTWGAMIIAVQPQLYIPPNARRHAYLRRR